MNDGARGHLPNDDSWDEVVGSDAKESNESPQGRTANPIVGAPPASAPTSDVRGTQLRGTLKGGVTPPASLPPPDSSPRAASESRVRSVPPPRSEPPEEGSRPTEPALFYCITCIRVAITIENGRCLDCGQVVIIQRSLEEPPSEGDPTETRPAHANAALTRLTKASLEAPRVPELGGTDSGEAVSELGTTEHAQDRKREASDRPIPPGGQSGTVRSNRPPAPGSYTLGYSSAYSMRASTPPAERREEPTQLTRVDPLIGLIIAERYRIQEPLGRGGMGIVYKVEHTRIGKLLAMKLLAGELSMNPEVVKRFKHEALTVSKLSSPNTVQVFDYGVSDGLTYLVMELVTGEDLGRLLRSHDALHPAKLGQIVVQVCNSLAEAHQKGIVHRDIKPENIMITRSRDETDFAKVCDFGLAKLREGSELNELTSQGAIVGTPYYMSPEQVRGDEVDARSDVYSLGAVMYRALTGHYAFNGPTPMSVFAKHLTEMPPPPHERAPDLAIPIGMSDIVMRALAKDPSERFQRIEDMQAAITSEIGSLGTSGIESLLDSETIQRIVEAPVIIAQGKEPGPSPVATRDEVEAYERKLQRWRWFVLAIVAVIPIALGLGGIQLYQRYRASAGRFSGFEIEPNNTATQATEVPFGSSVSATLGKRLSNTQSDLDVFAVSVPESAKLVSLKVNSIPNIPMCTQVFKKGESSPLVQFCTGRSNVALDVPHLRLPPGPYLFTVLEDMNPYGENGPRYVFENVSDEYSLTLDEALADPTFEAEPNDVQQAANAIEPSGTVAGTLGWVGDVDVFCAQKLQPDAKYRFRISDDPRDGVLAVSFIRGVAGEGPIVRVHTEPSARLTPDVAATDRLGPYLGPSFEGSSPACAILRATVNPLSKENSGPIPRGSSATYHVSLEEVTAKRAP